MGLLFLLLDRVFQILSALILIRVLLSWAGVFGLNQPIVRTLDRHDPRPSTSGSCMSRSHVLS